MRVTLSVGGKFQAFNLGEQLFKRGYLNKLITSYPKFAVAQYGIPKDKVNSVIIKELIERGWKLTPNFIKHRYNPQYLIHEIFDRTASHLFSKSDLCVAWSGFGLHTIRKAKEMGAVTVIDEGSSHILFQQMMLREEYDKFRLKPQLSHPMIVKKELQEYREADYISIPSLFVKRTFIEKGVSEKKLIHVPYGVDLKMFRQIPKNDNIFRVIFGGGLTLRKGVHYLLQAFSELNLKNTELLLIGPLSEEIIPFLKKNKGNYKRINYQPLSELYKLYSQGSVFVLMSVEEGLALVLPQAMACGLPIICTRNTGGEDIVRDGVDGFVISIRDVEALKEKLVYLYENPDICKAMGQNAKERVSKGFTWDDYGQKIINAYEKIFTQRRFP